MVQRDLKGLKGPLSVGEWVVEDQLGGCGMWTSEARRACCG